MKKLMLIFIILGQFTVSTLATETTTMSQYLSRCIESKVDFQNLGVSVDLIKEHYLSLLELSTVDLENWRPSKDTINDKSTAKKNIDLVLKVCKQDGPEFINKRRMQKYISKRLGAKRGKGFFRALGNYFAYYFGAKRFRADKSFNPHIFESDQATIASTGTTLVAELIENRLLPRGSAMLTESGSLSEKGINFIIHAAPGAMSQAGEHLMPSQEGVALSLKNSVILANLEPEIKKLAIPFVGGAIFIDSIGIEKEELVETIMRAALSVQQDKEIIFVPYNKSVEDVAIFQSVFAKVIVDFPQSQNIASVKPGSLISFSDHGADAIVNAANMEVTFGGGLSGLIGRFTEKAEEINQIASDAIASFLFLD